MIWTHISPVTKFATAFLSTHLDNVTRDDRRLATEVVRYVFPYPRFSSVGIIRLHSLLLPRRRNKEMGKITVISALLIGFTLCAVLGVHDGHQWNRKGTKGPKNNPLNTGQDTTTSTSTTVPPVTTTRASIPWKTDAEGFPLDESTGDFNDLSEIPLSARVIVGKVTDLKEFYDKYVVNPIPGPGELTSPSTTTAPETVRHWPGRGRGRSGAKLTTTAPPPVTVSHMKLLLDSIKDGVICHPANQTVPIPKNFTKPNFLVIPQCVTVARCGGCCLDRGFVCEPVETEVVEHAVQEFKYVPNETHHIFEPVQYLTFQEIHHTRCACNCRFKVEHCSGPHHIYHKERCGCGCTNVEEHEHCMRVPEKKFWNSRRCACECRAKKTECTSGWEFDTKHCDCFPAVSENETE